MLTARIKIGDDGTYQDTVEGWGLVYLSSDSRLASDIKDFEATQYPEEEGEHILPKTVDAPFDYKVKFFIRTSTRENANAKVAAFNNAISTQDATTKVRTFKKIYFHDEYKKVLIVGYPKPMAEPDKFWRDTRGNALDVVTVELLIRVTTPSECDFNYDSSD